MKDLRLAVERLFNTLPFEPPITEQYCARLRDALRPCLPKDTLLDVFHRHTEIVVEARIDGDVHSVIQALA